ncbi:hypothetical protein [Falsigemmobacter faecalis]|uniref:Ig-like domain-containing protein n=1 Tax=Falsigemmobacter faecalis TaxID=2488730 RepID=A0A3P3DR86_9RHOB|nr:hypothetical protein [Falsigemmobacter faecalis]RRH75158.1 hypothetical protein EG244_09240 [Falsigemmobacter faecalis]
MISLSCRPVLLTRPLMALLFGLSLPQPGFAGDSVKVTSLKPSTAGFYEVTAATPTAGRTITCILRDGAGKALSRNSWVSVAPETTVPIRHPDNNVVSAVCSATED